MVEAITNANVLSQSAVLRAAHALPADSVLKDLGTDAQRGLTDTRVTELRNEHGPNDLAEELPIPLWKKFLAQFNELVIRILIVAAVISGFLGEWTDMTAILAIVFLNALIGFLQEERAEQALAALQKLSQPMAKVIRDGKLQTVPARELVPGDRIELEAGDRIPADARLLEAFAFRAQEAALTGESAPVNKDAGALLKENTPLADRCTMVYMATVASNGKASAVV